MFPKNTLLVSAVYAVRVSKPLLQPLRLDVQHCVNLVRPSQTNYLKFAIAPVNTPTLPYEFRAVEGGQFTINSYYGSIYRHKFCLVGVVGEDGTLPYPVEEKLDEEEQDGDTDEDNSTSTQDEEDTSSDSESTQSNDSQTQGQSLYNIL